MNGVVVIDVCVCFSCFLHRWVVDAQLVVHHPNVVDLVLLVVVTHLDVLDVVAKVPTSNIRSIGYVKAIGIFDVVDPDVDPFSTFDPVDVLLVVFISLLSVLTPCLMLLL